MAESIFISATVLQNPQEAGKREYFSQILPAPVKN